MYLMDNENLKKELDRAFQLSFSQREAPGGYSLEMLAGWMELEESVSSYVVQLVGEDPRTGKELEPENIRVVFSFDKKNASLQLNYHGTFRLRCSAVLKNRDIPPVVFREQEIQLICPQNEPYIEYKILKEKFGFSLIEIRTNCWKRCRGKVWIRAEGHDQRISQKDRNGKIRLYIRGTDGVTLIAEDRGVKVRKGR